MKFDFDNGDAALFGLPGVSCNADEANGIAESHDGDFTQDATATKDGVSITVSAAEEGAKNANRISIDEQQIVVLSQLSQIVSHPCPTPVLFLYMVGAMWQCCDDLVLLDTCCVMTSIIYHDDFEGDRLFHELLM